MNNSELEKAYDEYEKLLDEKNYLEQDLADLGERKGNAPKEEFDKVKEKLNAIYDKIEKVGEKIAELSKDNDESNEKDEDSKDSIEDRDENINNKISSNLIVEFEEREKEIYEGTFILDGLRMSEEEQKQKIIDMMKKDGVEVKNPDNLIISYEGADDDYGISETQTTRFVVKEKKVVPVQYRVSKEEIYRGTYILDGPRISEKQQRERIYNMMREAGVQVDDKDSLDIRYEGANDNDGISETQTSEVVVYRVSKEEVAELTNDLESEDKNRLGRDDEISFESESVDAKNSNEIQKDENMKSEEKEVLTSIVYELEDGYKDIYEGTLALDGLRMSEKEQKQKIIDMMKKDGVEVKNPDNLIIGYDGADDDYGISETQTTKFVVREKTKYKVPYKVTEEEIYRGTYILDGPRISEEEQKERIYNMMRDAGIQVGDKDSLDIRYEGASDDEGISETQTSEVVVYRVSKEKVESTELPKEEVIDEKEEELSTNLKSELSEIKELKEQLKSISSDVEREELISKISEKLSNLEKKVDTVEDDFSKELLEIEKNIKDAEKVLKEDLEKYEQSYEKLKSIITEYNKKKEEADILTDEELDKLNDEYNAAKMVENDNAKQIKSEIDIFKKNLSSLKRKRTAIKKDIMNANALGLSVNEYKEITSTLAKKKILDEVLSRKGLTDIINTSAKERTKEQKATLKQAKADVLNEIAEFERNSTSKVSALDAIVALYNIDSKVIEAEKPRNVKVKKDELMVINDNSKKLPARINNPVANNALNNDTPLRAPEDMVIVNEIKQNENNSEKPIYEGVLANDPIRRSNAEIKQAILNEMIANGVDVDSIDDFDLEIEPVEDNNGISDSLYNNYKVYRKDREKSSDDGRQLPAEVDNSKQLPSVVDDSKQLPAEVDNSKQLPSVVDEKNIAEDEDLAFEEGKGLTEKYRIYVDSENNSICYVPIPTIERFGIANHGMNIKVDGITCNRISLDAARYIIENANNNYSPYEVEIRSIPSIKEFNENDVNERIDILTDENTGNKYARKYAFTRFNLVRDDSTLQRVDGAAWYRISDDDEAFIRGNANNDYSPYVVEDMSRELKPIIPEPVQPTTAPVYNSNEVNERIDILTDKNTGNKYARKYAFTRFNLDRDDSTLQRVDGAAWYRISDDDEAFIRGNANNDYSPYVVEDMSRELKPIIPEPVQPTTAPVYNSDNVKERIDILTDKNTGHKYARKYAFTRFNLDRDDSTLQRVDGSVWYRINDEDEAFIRGNANNDYSPYVVRDVRRELKPTIPDSVQQTTPPTTAVPTTGINITTPPTTAAPTTGINITTPPTTAAPTTGINITTPPTTAAPTTGINITTPPTTAAPTTGINITTPPTTAAPTTIPKPEPVPKADDHAKPHVEEIINKLMTGLDVQAKDAKRYTASNIKVASKFKNELRSGNYLYNIVHVVPATFKSGISLFNKLVGKLMTSKRAKDSMHELEKRVNNLTEEELEVLFEEYRGSQLKTDMNVQINPLILPKLKEYGMKKVQAYNVSLTNCYSSLFNDLGTINSIDEQLSGNIDDALRSQLEVQRKDIYAKASNEIRTIIDTRNKANNLLSGGIHGLEEDFKAVATKLSYAGMRFAKVGKFDNELQKKLAHEGKGLNTALYEKNDEDVVKHFVGLETLYHENTDIRGSVFGTRSEGAKYYSPLAAEFDYRDDPFIRDLFTTVSLTTAAISAVNAFRVHQIEQQRIIDGKNQEINNANSVNDGRMDYVHQTANDITGKRQTFSEGMKAQAQQDSANIANAQERASLDSTNWGFGSQYRATDDAHHAFFNQNYDNVTSQINDITSRYGQGNITEAQALQELAQVANSSQSTLSQVASDCLNILRPYAATHPQFDLHAVEESFNYMVTNPDAIVNMNNAAIDVTNLAEGLKGLSAEHVSALSSLPSDMLTTFMAAASSAALAYNVSKSMDANKRKGRYGNQVTDMMNDYLNGSEEAEDVSENTRRR